MNHQFRQGSIPLLVSIPHNGSHIPRAIAATMTADGRSSRDTDWFLKRLYDFPELALASLLVAEQSRYVIDLNRSSNNESLYPGQATTGLIPATCFDGAKIYAGELPDDQEVQKRIAEVWTPYHDRLQNEMKRMTAEHGVAVLVEAHSIASVVPRLFEGTLPDFNLGTNRGESCDPELQTAIVNVLESQSDYSHIVNGRFVGGYITRNFGRPADNWHSIQIELSQATYMDEATLQWDDAKAQKVQPVFRDIISTIVQWLVNKTN